MRTIPTAASLATAADQDLHRRSVEMLTDALVEKLRPHDCDVSVTGTYSDAVIGEVATSFAASGWRLTKTGQSRSTTSFSIKRA